VAFGAALHGLGLYIKHGETEGREVSEIIAAHEKGEGGKLQKTLPVYEAVFEMAIKTLPNPRDAQAYRIEKIWDGHIESQIGKALVECSDEGPTVFCVTNVHSDSDGGTVAVGRLFSGKVQKGNRLHLVDALAETVVKQAAIDMGSFREEVNWIPAGNLASLTLTGEVKAGETLVDLDHKAEMVPFESISYVSETRCKPWQLNPKIPKISPFLLEEIEKLASEDPNLKVVGDRKNWRILAQRDGRATFRSCY